MSRFALAFAAAALVSLPAQAARLAHPTAAARTVENRVTVWRGAAVKTAQAPARKQAPACTTTKITVAITGWPQRRLRTRGFTSGDAFKSAYTVTTQGFYADRMAAGL